MAQSGIALRARIVRDAALTAPQGFTTAAWRHAPDTSTPPRRVRCGTNMAISGAAAGSAMHGERIPSLDGFRAISIGLVVFGHLLGTSGFLPLDVNKHLALGELGVRV